RDRRRGRRGGGRSRDPHRALPPEGRHYVGRRGGAQGLMSHEALLAYVTLFAPLAATIVITLLTLKHKTLSGLIALAGIVAGLVCTGLFAMDVFAGKKVEPHEVEWLK